VRVAITGASGQLGSALVRAIEASGWTAIPLTRPGFQLESPLLPPAIDMVIHAAAWTDVDGCARDPRRAMALNGKAAGLVAAAAHARGSRIVHISTNEVFDGAAERPYPENAPTRPINAYGKSKLAGEEAVRVAHPDAVVVRTAWVHTETTGFPTRIVAAARTAAVAGQPLGVVADEFGNPTPAAALADRLCRLIAHPDAPPIIHLAGIPPVARYGWASRVLADAGLPEPQPMRLADFQRESTPPPRAVLDTSLSGSLGLSPIRW
jgi:dTDP-4-dehydrorhamnose reductase